MEEPLGPRNCGQSAASIAAGQTRTNNASAGVIPFMAGPPPFACSSADPSLLADAPQIRLALDVDAPVRDRRRRVVGAVVQVVDGEDFKLGAARDHVTLAGAGEIDTPVGRGDGAGTRRDVRRFFLVDLFPVGQRPGADEGPAAAVA